MFRLIWSSHKTLWRRVSDQIAEGSRSTNPVVVKWNTHDATNAFPRNLNMPLKCRPANGRKMTPTLKRPINIFYWQSRASPAAACFTAFAGIASSVGHNAAYESVHSDGRRAARRRPASFRTVSRRRSGSVSFEVQLHPSIKTPRWTFTLRTDGLASTQHKPPFLSRPYVRRVDGCRPINICPVALRRTFVCCEMQLWNCTKCRDRRYSGDATISVRHIQRVKLSPLLTRVGWWQRKASYLHSLRR